MGITLLQLADRIPTEADAYRELERMRWADRPVCAHCDSENVAYIEPANGVSRATRTGAMSQRRVWQCRDCRKQFSATTGSVMHGSKISLRIWLLVIFEMCADKNGISAREVERKYGMCPRSAWHLLHRIRAAMANGGLLPTMRGTIVADETFIGGAEKNKHHQGQPRKSGTRMGPGRSPFDGKVAVLSLINVETGEARSRVVPKVSGANLRKVMAEHVDMAGSTLHTDSARHYRPMSHEFALHQWVDHAANEYVRGEVTTNQAENFFSQLKRSLDGTHHHVSEQHLERYLGEFDYRYSTRELNDTQRMNKLMGQVGGTRLTYKRVSHGETLVS